MVHKTKELNLYARRHYSMVDFINDKLNTILLPLIRGLNGVISLAILKLFSINQILRVASKENPILRSPQNRIQWVLIQKFVSYRLQLNVPL